MWPSSLVSPSGSAARPPEATARTGCVPIAQLHTSRLWTCCSTMWSPQTHTKWYQLCSWNARSLTGTPWADSSDLSRNQPPPLFQDEAPPHARPDPPAVDALHRLAVAGLVPPLRARRHPQPLL